MLEFFVNFITGGAGTKCSLFDVRKGHRSDNLVGEIRIKQKEADVFSGNKSVVFRSLKGLDKCFGVKMVRLIRFINIKLFPVAPVKRKHGIGIFGGENAQYQMIVFVLKFHDGSLRFAFS